MQVVDGELCTHAVRRLRGTPLSGVAAAALGFCRGAAVHGSSRPRALMRVEQSLPCWPRTATCLQDPSAISHEVG